MLAGDCMSWIEMEREQFNVMLRTCASNQISLILRLDKPVPGIDIDARTPVRRPFTVNWNGPNLIDLVIDLIPFSVMLIPAMVLSKLNDDLFI